MVISKKSTLSYGFNISPFEFVLRNNCLFLCVDETTTMGLLETASCCVPVFGASHIGKEKLLLV